MPDRRIKLAVVIINFKTADLVMQCLESLLPQFADLDAQVVVVDNHSQDDSVTRLRDWLASRPDHDAVTIIEAAVNGGFSAGNNTGIRAIAADYYLLLNSDTIVRPGAIATLLETADAHPEAGLVSPRLEWQDGVPQENCFRYLSPMSELIDAAQTGLLTSALKRFDIPLPVSHSVIRPDWTSFAGVMLRREMLRDVGMMDEGFFMYFEDVEFCRRVRKAGWEIIHNPKAKVVHLRGGSSPVKRRALEGKRLPRYYYASRTRYFYLSYGRIGLTLANVLWSLGRCVSKSRELIERRGRGVPDKRWLDIWTNWLTPGVLWSKQQSQVSGR